jgi:hypothetical protein
VQGRAWRVGMALLQAHRRHAKMAERQHSDTGSAGRSEERDGKIGLSPCGDNK